MTHMIDFAFAFIIIMILTGFVYLMYRVAQNEKEMK